MRRFGWFFTLLLVAGLVTVQARAEMTPGMIVQACPNIKVRLKQTYLNDDLTRVNYGQTYESLLKNIMTPTNARLVANRYNASELVRLTTDLEASLNQFRSRYQVYKTERDRLINKDCQAQPEEFYDKLQTVRQLRAELRVLVDQMRQQSADYQTTFERAISD